MLTEKIGIRGTLDWEISDSYPTLGQFPSLIMQFKLTDRMSLACLTFRDAVRNTPVLNPWAVDNIRKSGSNTDTRNMYSN